MCPLRPDQHALVLLARPMVARIARRLRRAFRHLDEDDLAQWAQEGVIEALPLYDATRGPFEAWAWKRGYGRALDAARRDRRDRRRACLAMVTIDGVCAWTTTVHSLHDDMERRLALAALREVIGALDGEDKLLLRARHVEELTWADVGGAIGVGERQAKRRDIDLRAKLRRALASHGIEAPPPFEIG